MQRAINHEIWTFFFGDASCFAHFINVCTLTRSTGRVRDHRYARLNTEGRCRVGRLDSNLSQLLCVWIWVDRTVTVYQYLIRQQHKEDR
ncbi:Uncharacterised protein [Vibrio cholerae]|nr:Uncharacterised protein [Vibrio cholerae]CSA58800.1 Uncharacterised protein [Vibrio cholerae]CSI40375.1 Uncharacterised protein [Vibrio cholerae]